MQRIEPLAVAAMLCCSAATAAAQDAPAFRPAGPERDAYFGNL